MKKHVLFLRHAVAMDRAEFAKSGTVNSKDDSKRPLTEQGRKKFQKVLKKLQKKKLKKVKIIASPFTRTLQTAEMVSKAVGKKIHTSKLLEPGHDPAKTLKLIDQSKKNLLLIGHEPALSQLLTQFAGEKQEEFKKGEVRCFKKKKKSTKLEWKITP